MHLKWTKTSYVSSLQHNFCLTPPLHFTIILRFSPIWSFHLLEFQYCYGSYEIHSLSQIHSGVINANVSILRLTARCMAGCASMLYEGVYENVRHGRREKRKKRRSRGVLSCLRILPPLHRWRSLGSTRAYVCVCRVCVYVAARYYRIILGYFTGTRKASLGRARIASQTIVIRSRERTKGNEREAESLEGFCFAWYDDITRVKGTPESWERADRHE